jgi:hypothetical protein
VAAGDRTSGNTIFATGKNVVVLPQLIDDVTELFREAELRSEEVDSSAGCRQGADGLRHARP